MQEAARPAALKRDRIMADGLGLMAYGHDGRVHEPYAISHQPLAMAQIRDLMWRHAGLFRSREGLTEAVEALERAPTSASPTTAEGWREHNLLTVARLIARAALRREESRGGHYREDFPTRDDAHWKVHLTDARGAA
jgi:aspartate oxidase